MRKKKKLLTEEELFRRGLDKIVIESEMSNIEDGKALRKYAKSRRKEIEDLGIEIPEWRKYPYLLLMLKFISIVLWGVYIFTMFYLILNR